MEYLMDKNSWKRFSEPLIPAVPDTWKDTYTANADLISLGDQYLMYYRGTDKQHDRVGVMSCKKDKFDGLHWDDYSGNPIIDVGRENTFDEVNILDPSAVVVDGTVYLYYSAIGKKAETIGLATSEDGFNFTKRSDNPVLIGRCPEIVFHNNAWYLFFVRKNSLGGYSIHAALSGEGIRFSEIYKSALEPGNKGAWDSKSVTTPRIFMEKDTFYMVYAGDDNSLDDSRQFGLAVSNDLLTWEKYDHNPIFEKGSPGSWDDSNIWFGTTEKINNAYWMWYEGCNHRRGYADFVSVVGAAVLEEPYFFIKPAVSGLSTGGILSR
jgi:predicted GH43/DUF377 family glycosyl hydrolase